MKKFSIVAIIIALVMSLSLCFTACGGDDNKNKTATTNDVTKELTDAAPAIATAMLGVSEGPEYEAQVAALKAQFASEEFKMQTAMIAEQILAPSGITAKELGAVADVAVEGINYFIPRVGEIMANIGGGSAAPVALYVEDSGYVGEGEMEVVPDDSSVIGMAFAVMAEIKAEDINEIKKLGNNLLNALPAEKLANLIFYLSMAEEEAPTEVVNAMKSMLKTTMEFAYKELKAFLKVDTQKVMDTFALAGEIMQQGPAFVENAQNKQKVVDLIKYWGTFGGSCVPAMAELKNVVNKIISAMEVVEGPVPAETTTIINTIIDGAYALYKAESNYINAFNVAQMDAFILMVNSSLNENGEMVGLDNWTDETYGAVVLTVKAVNNAYTKLTAAEKTAIDNFIMFMLANADQNPEDYAAIKADIAQMVTMIVSMNEANMTEQDVAVLNELIVGLMGGMGEKVPDDYIPAA